MNKNEFAIIVLGVLILLLTTILCTIGVIAIDQAEVIRGYEIECQSK